MVLSLWRVARQRARERPRIPLASPDWTGRRESCQEEASRVKPYPNIRDLPMFAAVDRAKMVLSARKLAALANDGRWYTVKELARVAGCSEAAVSGRRSDLRKQGYTVAVRAVAEDGSGEVCKLHVYQISR